jgi:CRISPR/Cas system CSM-associated protein Csm5 (group 7 of RAMP superfamily)
MGTGKFPEVERLIVDELDLDTITDLSFEYGGKLTKREINTLIRDGNNDAYIPGSSIKGAMSSAIYHFLHEGIKPEHYNEQTANELLGTFDRALGRYMRPYDTSSFETEVNDIELYNLYRKGVNWAGDFKDGFRIIAETFIPNTEGVFRLTLADDLAAFIKKQKGDVALPTYYTNVFGEKPLETLFKIINNYTRTHVRRELLYFEQYNDIEDIDDVISRLQQIIKELDAIGETTCILRLSSGSGFHGITGDYRFKDHTSTIDKGDNRNQIYNRITKQREPARYKSRRLIYPYGGLMGFVRLEAK